MHRVNIVTIDASDQKALTQMQQKINQWLTTNLLVKYEIHTTSINIVFNILLKKEG